MGTAPSYFGTFTSGRYRWSSLHKLFEIRDKCDGDFVRAAGSTRHLVNTYHGLTAWFCALGLESLLKYCAKETLNLTDYIGIHEWPTTGALIHLHFAGWCKDAPRWDKVAADLKAKKTVLPRLRRCARYFRI